MSYHETYGNSFFPMGNSLKGLAFLRSVQTSSAPSCHGPEFFNEVDPAHPIDEVLPVSVDEIPEQDPVIRQTEIDSVPEEESDCDINKPLYSGSDISVGQCVFLILSFFLKHSLNKEALKGLLELLSHLLPLPNCLPATLYHLNTFLSNLSGSKSSVKKHYYCELCSFYIGEFPEKTTSQFKCLNCFSTQTSPGVFVEYPLDGVLRTLFENRELKFYEDQRGNRTAGKQYEELRSSVLNGQYDVTDGVPVFKSSNTQLWPLHITVLEVPPTLRNIFVTICGLWLGTGKPNMNTFLRPFCNSLKTLYETGFQWMHPVSKTIINSKVLAPLAVLDAPARASVLNMNQFNGKYGCPSCKSKGEVVNRGKGKARIYKGIDTPLRLDEESRYLAERAVSLGKPVFGVKGPTWAAVIPHLNLATSFSPDYMHCVLLGVVRSFLFLWLDSCHHLQQWYLGKSTANIDQKLTTIRPPSNIGRHPRSVKSRKLWKASEYRSWLLFYSLPVLKDIMLEKYFQHWMLLVHGIYILLKDNIDNTDLDLANILLQLFVFETPDLYPEEITCTFNLHQLLHLSSFAKNWGPLWLSSAFAFEFNNGLLLRLVHGSQSVTMQLVNSLQMMNGMWNLAGKYRTVPKSNDHCIVLGQGIAPQYLPDSLRNHPVITSYTQMGFGIYQRIQVKSNLFTSRMYTRQMKSTNFCVHLNGHYQFCLIECYMLKEKSILCVARALKETGCNFVHKSTGTSISHIVPVTESDIVFVTPVSSIISKAIHLNSYVCIQPNTVETQL